MDLLAISDSAATLPIQTQSLLDWVLTGTSLTALFGGGFALYKFLLERREDRSQRVRELRQQRIELRWRQAQAAKGLLDDMLEDKQAVAALDMLDSWSREFEISPGTRVVITAQTWLTALSSAPDMANAPIEMFVRDSFDGLLYHMAMLEHYIDRRFVRFEDVTFPLDYYISIMSEDRPAYQRYIDAYQLHRAGRFLQRFPAWLNPLPNQEATPVVDDSG